MLGCLGRTRTAAGLVCRLWIVGSEIGLLLGDLQALDVALYAKKNKEEKEPVGASPVAAPMPKSVPR